MIISNNHSRNNSGHKLNFVLLSLINIREVRNKRYPQIITTVPPAYLVKIATKTILKLQLEKETLPRATPIFSTGKHPHVTNLDMKLKECV